MKTEMMLGFGLAAALMTGCCQKCCRSSAAPPSGAKPVVVSDGTNTFCLGAVVVGGTNLPGTNITIGVRPSAGAK